MNFHADLPQSLLFLRHPFSILIAKSARFTVLAPHFQWLHLCPELNSKRRGRNSNGTHPTGWPYQLRSKQNVLFSQDFQFQWAPTVSATTRIMHVIQYQSMRKRKRRGWNFSKAGYLSATLIRFNGHHLKLCLVWDPFLAWGLLQVQRIKMLNFTAKSSSFSLPFTSVKWLVHVFFPGLPTSFDEGSKSVGPSYVKIRPYSNLLKQVRCKSV